MLLCSLNYARSVRESHRKQDNKRRKTLYYIIRYTNEKKQIKIVLTFKLLKIMEMNYVAPELEVLEVLVEQGFAGSSMVNNPGEPEDL